MTENVDAPKQVRTSYSALTQHRTCPQKWVFSRVRGLERIPQEELKAELEFGNWWHALRAADSIERGRASGTLRYCPEVIKTADGGPKISTSGENLTQNVTDAAMVWWSALGSIYKGEWSAKMGGDLPDLLAYKDACWHERWDADLENEQVLAVELPWGRELPGLVQPDGEERNPNTRIGGYVDEVYMDTRRGMIVVRDHKTGKALSAASTAEDMMESQLQLYAWGTHPLVAEWDLGPVRAVAYDRVRSTMPKSPKLTQAGSLSKQVTDFDARTYETWARAGQEYPGRKKDGSDGGVYEIDLNMLEYLRQPDQQSKWFQRTLTPLNRNVVQAHLRAAVDTALDANMTRERFGISGHAPRNFGKACTWCEYAQLCRAEMIGGPDGDYDLEAYGLRARPAK